MASAKEPVQEPVTLQARLQRYVARAFSDYRSPVVEGFEEISAGWESDVYAFDLAHGPDDDRQVEDRVLRLYPGADAYEKSLREFAALRDLHRIGYPVPEVYALEREASPFDRPFLIMERVSGRSMWHATFHGPAKRRQSLFSGFCELLVRLHTLDWRAFSEASDRAAAFVDDPYVFVDGWFSMMSDYFIRMGQPGYQAIGNWLIERRDQVPCARPAPVHWDFHPDNVLVGEDESMVVIDWTQFDISDPRFDLAWTLVLIGSQEGTVWRDRILSTYERLLGEPVVQLDFFEAFACVKRLASVTLSLSGGSEALGMRPGAESMMLAHMGALKRVYARLLELAGVRVPEVEAMFETYG